MQHSYYHHHHLRPSVRSEPYNSSRGVRLLFILTINYDTIYKFKYAAIVKTTGGARGGKEGKSAGIGCYLPTYTKVQCNPSAKNLSISRSVQIETKRHCQRSINRNSWRNHFTADQSREHVNKYWRTQLLNELHHHPPCGRPAGSKERQPHTLSSE